MCLPLSGWLSNELLAGRFFSRGVARKRRERYSTQIRSVHLGFTLNQEGSSMTMIGIDPHKATHTAVAINDNEAVLDEFTL